MKNMDSIEIKLIITFMLASALGMQMHICYSIASTVHCVRLILRRYLSLPFCLTD